MNSKYILLVFIISSFAILNNSDFQPTKWTLVFLFLTTLTAILGLIVENKKCLKCGSVLGQKRFCGNCGWAPFCSKCKREITSSSGFCTNCEQNKGSASSDCNLVG